MSIKLNLYNDQTQGLAVNLPINFIDGYELESTQKIADELPVP